MAAVCRCGGGAWRRRSRPPNAERAAEEAARRARAKIRRYAAANRLNRLGTLTYGGEGCHDPVRLRGGSGRVLSRAARRAGRGRFPYVWVPQWHPGGHGLHAHFAVGRFVPRASDRARLGARLRAHQAARRAAGRLGRRWPRRGLLPATWPATSGRDLERRAPAGGAAPLRGRAGLPAGQDLVLRRRRPRT